MMPRKKGKVYAKVLGVAVTIETLERLRTVAESQRRKIGEMHRLILEDGLEQYEKRNGKKLIGSR
jgi:hypothetical protein